jgi:hypothetical protein
MRLCRCVAVLALAALSALGACTNGGTPPGSQTTGRNAQMQAATHEVAACVRANGVPDLPDPTFDDQGNPQLPRDMDPDNNAAVRAALDGPCRQSLDRLNALIGEQEQERQRQEEQRPVLSADDQAKVRAYAQCIREHGLPDWPDADPTGRFLLPTPAWPEGLGKGDRPIDRTFLSALEACPLDGPQVKIG